MARERKATIEYTGADGVTSKRVSADAPVIAFKFTDGRVASIDTRDLDPDLLRLAAIRGVTERIRDTFAGSESVDDAYNEAVGMIEVLIAGDWAAERAKGEAAPSMIAEAVVRAANERLTASGRPALTDEQAAALSAKYTGKGTEEARKAAGQNVAVAKHLAAIKAEREQAKIAKLEKAGGTDIFADL